MAHADAPSQINLNLSKKNKHTFWHFLKASGGCRERPRVGLASHLGRCQKIRHHSVTWAHQPLMSVTSPPPFRTQTNNIEQLRPCLQGSSFDPTYLWTSNQNIKSLFKRSAKITRLFIILRGPLDTFLRPVDNEYIYLSNV